MDGMPGGAVPWPRESARVLFVFPLSLVASVVAAAFRSLTLSLFLPRSFSPLVQYKDVRATTIVSCVGGTVDIGRQIVDYTRDKDSDILMMGSRGLGSLKRAVLGFIGLGSVSSYVVKHADCNVLVHKVPALE